MPDITPTVVETPAVDPSATPPVEQPVSDETPAAITAESATAEGAAPDSEPSETENVSDEEDAPGKPRSQVRIEELATTNKYLREHNEFLREALNKALDGQKPAKPEAAPAVPEQPAAPARAPMPTLESCGYDEVKHAEAVAKWVDETVSTQVNTALSKRDEAVEAKSNDQVLREAAEQFRGTHKDFDLVIGNPKLQWSPTVLQALREAGQESAALGYYLGTNPDKLAKISTLKPTQQLVAIGRIQAELAVAPPKPAPKVVTPTPKPAPVPKKPTTTNAPPPPKPVQGTASPDIDPMTLSGTEWAKWRRQQLAEKTQAKKVASY